MINFIHFGLRMEIERQYLDWCERESIANKPNSLVVFMIEKGWLNEEKIIKDLKESKDELQKHCHRPNNMACHPEQGDMWCRECDYWYANEPQIDDFFRNLTAEERKAVADYIDSISVPTGVNVFDFMDKPQTKRGK